jgi:hypothetical protein
MEDTQVVFSQDDQIIGFNVQLNMEGTNSNRHGGEKEEDINMVETLIKLQTHVNDNMRLMKTMIDFK